MKNRKWDSSFRQLQLHSPLQWQFFITLPYSICYEETAVWSSWPNWALSEEEMSCFWCVHRVPLCSFESLPHSGLLRGPWARGSRVHPTHKHGPGVRKSLKRILKQKIPLEIWMGKNKTRGEKGGGGLSPFLLLLGLYSWCEEKVSRSERLGMCELRGVEREQWLRFPEEARQGLRKPPRLIYH